MGSRRTSNNRSPIRTIMESIGWMMGGGIIGALIWMVFSPVEVPFLNTNEWAINGVNAGAPIGVVVGLLIWAITTMIQTVSRRRYFDDGDEAPQFEITRGGFKETRIPGAVTQKLQGKKTIKSSVKRIPESTDRKSLTRMIGLVLSIVVIIGMFAGVFVSWGALVESIGTFNLTIYGTVVLVVILMIVIAILEGTSNS